MSQKVIIIGGATASGKSGLALDLALQLNGVVINADSMQVYKHLPVLSAAPSEADKAKVPHRLYEIYEPDFNGTVVEWLELAVAEIRTVWAEEKLPIVVGGTGMYLDNLINGTTPIPEPDAAIRAQARLIAEQEGVGGLYQRLQKIDPAGAAMVGDNDMTRVLRAYEIMVQTGKSIAEWYQIPRIKKLPEAEFVVLKIVPEAHELDERCYERFEHMLKQGAEAEVQQLAKLNLDPKLPAMKMLGVPELLEVIRGKCRLEKATELAKLHTRQYAKRQRTWFKNQLVADITLTSCYNKTDVSLINDVKKLISCCAIGHKVIKIK